MSLTFIVWLLKEKGKEENKTGPGSRGKEIFQGTELDK